MKKLLVVDDDPSMRDIIERKLGPDIGLEITLAYNYREGLAYGLSNPFDLFLLDYALDQYTGLELLKQLSEKRSLDNRVVLFSAKVDRGLEIEAYNLGVSNILSKPMDFDLLRAVINKNLRTLNTDWGRVNAFFDLKLDFNSRRVLVGEGKTLVNLTPSEFHILGLLVSAQGRVVSKEELSMDARDSNKYMSYKTVEMHLSSLRKKLSQHSSLKISSRWGVGYFLEPASQKAIA